MKDVSAEDAGNLRQNVAFCFQVQGKLERALEEYRKTLEYRREANDKRGEAMTLARIAECELGLGRLDSAKENALVALSMFREIGDVNRVKQVEQTLQKIAAAQSKIS